MADKPLERSATARLRRKIRTGRELRPLVKIHAAERLDEYVPMVSALLHRERIALAEPGAGMRVCPNVYRTAQSVSTRGRFDEVRTGNPSPPAWATDSKS